MSLPTYTTLRVTVTEGVADIVLDNPPVNTLNATMMVELHDLLERFRDDPSVVVLVFSSAHEEFFLAHVDMGIFDSMGELQDVATKYPNVNVHQGIGELLRKQPQVSIVKLAGIARAGGAEFVVAADITYAAEETARIAQSEVLLGIIPGGGATQYGLERMGRNRTLETVLSAELLTARTAADYGWINRAVPAAELDEFVATTARNIAALGMPVIAGAKKAIPAADLTAGLNAENDAWWELVQNERAQKIMTAAGAANMQAPENERHVEEFLRDIASTI
ncbi:enoyl-CoA hydratase/isomerase family protein [Kineosporia babensis]|uniref:Enoyl-CoA hydratase/isomerase family protein n=1 Tax=Kineosporia babensis TaxID=499548 RepID=A0A9X1STY5_9ACTN|nr:enoyl-CoA hydratase/isomerase family protein [Kineosporia babensis]MCD5311816.1 enoyl-CoA hydratase/isomerase family protein [Kineosporia babensis]